MDSENKLTILVPPNWFNAYFAITDCIYLYGLSYDGDYVDAEDQITMPIENSCFPIDFLTNYCPLDNIIRSSRDLPS